MRGVRCWPGWGLLILAAGCSAPPSIRFESVQSSSAIRARARALEVWAREGWHRPLTPRIYLSNAASNALMVPEQRACEERLAVAQLDQVQRAYAQGAFDVYGVELNLVDGARREARLEAETGWLTITLPAPAPGEPPQPIACAELLRSLAQGFAWDGLGPWWRGERTHELLAALRVDLRELDTLEDELHLRCGQLDLLGGVLAQRQAEALTPSEHAFARAAQLQAGVALHRVLNVLARWRHAAEDPAFSLGVEAGVVLLRARLIHDAYLTWLLDTVVGGRTATRFWTGAFWHRNLLYKALDGRVDLTVVAEGATGELPAGSIRALLSRRLDLDLRAYFEAIDARVPELGPRLGQSPLAPELRQAWDRCQQVRAVLEAHDLSGFTAWKELWDARLKGSFSYPVYEAVAAVASLIGDTRLELREPAVRPHQLSRLAETLRPGDIVLVRQDGYLSNAFLPGFWTHALLYLGPRDAWGALRLPEGHALQDDPAVGSALAGWEQPLDDDGPSRVLEAVSEGVVFSSLEHALGKDYLAVLRPRLPRAQLAEGLRRALACWGRPYDFDFDFASDDRLVCTELVYRAFDDALNFRVQVDAELPPVQAVPGVLPVLGRMTMPANELARYAVYMYDHPEPNPELGYPGRHLELVRVFDRVGDRTTEYVGIGGLEILRDSTTR